MSDPSGLRVGNTERSEVIALLRSSAAEGRLTELELSDRIGRTEQARTFADLDALVADLPVTPPSQIYVARHQPPDRPGWDASNPLVVGDGLGNERRSGTWEIPPFLRIDVGLSSVRLNCLEAVCPAPRIDIQVGGGAGSVYIIVPDGWGADTNQLSKGLGTLRVRVNREPDPGHPQLVLRGSLGMSTLKVRPANSRERRRLDRAVDARKTPELGWARPETDMPNADDLR